MSLLCDHDWEPRTGMDSGSYCTKCQKISNKEVKSPSTGLSQGTLNSRIEQLRVDSTQEKTKFKFK